MIKSLKVFLAWSWFLKYFALQDVVEMLEEVVVSWREVRRVWRMRQSRSLQLLQRPAACCTEDFLTRADFLKNIRTIFKKKKMLKSLVLYQYIYSY